MDQGELSLSELLLDDGVSPANLCRRALSRAVECLSNCQSQETSSWEKAGQVLVESILQCLRTLALLLKEVEAQDLTEIGSSCFNNVCVSYMKWLSVEYGSIHQHVLATAVKAVALLLASLVENDKVLEGTIINWFVEVVNDDLCSQQSIQSEQLRDKDTMTSLAMKTTSELTVSCSIILPILQLMLESSHVQKSGDCFGELFEALLKLVQNCDSSTHFFHISSTLLPLFITDSQDDRLKKVWHLIRAVHFSKTTVESNSLELVLTLLCCLHDVFIGQDESSPFSRSYPTSLFNSTGGRPVLDLRKEDDFWAIVQDGLNSPDPLSRKRCMYLLHCVLVSVQKSCGDSDGDSGDIVSSSNWIFWWEPGSAKQLLAVWDDLVLVLETLEEKQVQVDVQAVFLPCKEYTVYLVALVWAEFCPHQWAIDAGRW